MARDNSIHPTRLLSILKGNSYVTGAFGGDPPFYSDFGTLKLSNNGNLIWNQRYNGPQSDYDESYGIDIDNNFNVYVTGFSTGVNTGSDITTIKYSQTIGINPISSEIPNNYSLSQNYPNPFNPVTKIRFNIPSNVKSRPGGTSSETENVKLVIFDILGREVATLVNEQLRPGTYEVEWNASAYPSGVYFYRLQSGSFNQTQKMVLIK